MTISLAEVQQLAEEMTEIDPQIERERYQDTIVERIMTVDPTVKDDVIGAFRAFDPEDSGNISVVMLRYVLQTLGEPLEDAAVDEMLRECEIDDDGNVNYYNYVSMVLFPAMDLGA
eukprot:scaffold1554_cov261-Pinguiococcus_pyrenoidosus.AAC.1